MDLYQLTTKVGAQLDHQSSQSRVEHTGDIFSGDVVKLASGYVLQGWCY